MRLILENKVMLYDFRETGDKLLTVITVIT